MKNLDKYKSLLGGELDGLLLTSRYSRHYAAEFDIAEGVALVFPVRLPVFYRQPVYRVGREESEGL